MATPSAERTLVIDRSIEDVFAFFTEPSNESRWRTHVKEISTIGVVAEGSRIHQVVAGPAGLGIPADIQVTAYEPPHRYAFRVVAGPVRPNGEFRFAAEGERTSVSLKLEATLAGAKKLLMTGPVKKSMDGEMQALDRAKAILEGNQS